MGKRGESRAALFFLLPSVTGLAVFFLLPFTETVRRSFMDARARNYVGLQSYTAVFSNSAFRLAAFNTARFICVCIPLLMGLSLVMALLVRAARPRGRAFKTWYLLPMAIPVASMVLLWQTLFGNYGLMNTLLVGMGAERVSFMESSAAFWVLIATYVWKNSGYDMILWLVGLDGISDHLYEAARVDGANALQCFRYITLPSLLPTTGLIAILSLLNSFKVFREAYLVSGSYPDDSIYLLQHLFSNWFSSLDISRLCAAATLLAIALFLIVLLLQRLLRERA